MSDASPMIEQSTPSAQATGSSVPNVQNPSHPSFRRYAPFRTLSYHRGAVALTSMLNIGNERVARVVSFLLSIANRVPRLLRDHFVGAGDGESGEEQNSRLTQKDEKRHATRVKVCRNR